MKYFVFITILIAAQKNVRAAVNRGNFTQKLDNFAMNSATFQMDYLSNTDFFKPGGPIFVMMTSPRMVLVNYWLENGEVYNMAQQNNAAMFFLQHRFYGFPENPKISSSNMKYLNVKQAMADMLTFIKYLKQNPVYSRSKVVLFGMKRGGNYAVWLRQQYPSIIHAAVAVSAPLKAQVGFPEFLQISSQYLYPDCKRDMTYGFKVTDLYLSYGKEGVDKVQRDFSVNYPLNSTNDKSYFFTSFAFWLTWSDGYKPRTCTYFMQQNTSSDVLVNSYNKVRYLQHEMYRRYQDYVKSLASLTDSDSPYMYQLCNEYGHFETSSSSDQPFYDYFPIQYYYQICKDAFGISESTLKSNVVQMNLDYKGDRPMVTRVAFVYGSNDPYKALGVTSNLNANAPAFVIPGAGISEYLYPETPTDSADLKSTRKKVQDYVKTWLSQP